MQILEKMDKKDIHILVICRVDSQIKNLFIVQNDMTSVTRHFTAKQDGVKMPVRKFNCLTLSPGGFSQIGRYHKG